LVVIQKGPLKGYKGSVVFANESTAEVQVHSKGYKVSVPREDIFILYNEMDGMRIQQNAFIPVARSFDEAAK
jgi:transcription elongation factor